MSTPEKDSDAVADTLKEILLSLRNLQQDHIQLVSAVDAISGKVNVLSDVEKIKAPTTSSLGNGVIPVPVTPHPMSLPPATSQSPSPPVGSPTMRAIDGEMSPEFQQRRTSLSSKKIILTSYPGQSGVDPYPMRWGHPDPAMRGPVVVSRNGATIRRRNGKAI